MACELDEYTVELTNQEGPHRIQCGPHCCTSTLARTFRYLHQSSAASVCRHYTCAASLSLQKSYAALVFPSRLGAESSSTIPPRQRYTAQLVAVLAVGSRTRLVRRRHLRCQGTRGRSRSICHCLYAPKSAQATIMKGIALTHNASVPVMSL